MPLRTRLSLANLADSCGTRLGTSGGVAQQIARDYDALHFTGAFVNCEHASIAIITLDVCLAGIADAAMYLHGAIGDTIGHFAGVQFCARGRGTETARAGF